MIGGLDDAAHAAITAVLARHAQISEARVFGSRAMGTHHHHSDIDLALWGAIDHLLLGRIIGELDELPLPFRFDVAVFADIESPELRAHIERRGRPCYRRDDATIVTGTGAVPS